MPSGAIGVLLKSKVPLSWGLLDKRGVILEPRSRFRVVVH